MSSEEPAIEPPGAPYVRKLPRRSLTSDIINELLSLIASGGFAHDRLPPGRDLSRQSGVSRSALREALSVLDHVGAIETRGKSKYGRPAMAVAQTIAADRSVEREFVSGPLEARRILEPEVAALARSQLSVRATTPSRRYGRDCEEGRMLFGVARRASTRTRHSTLRSPARPRTAPSSSSCAFSRIHFTRVEHSRSGRGRLSKPPCRTTSGFSRRSTLATLTALAGPWNDTSTT